ncbi:15322_t:CDS:2 [Cetraspora pellucida]|uniref:15322_t:CDS:1 n=1 Tax=Cetraspora pellucida TaxID=1433469 RepID=A0A9N9HYJ0_9GLOM|nr:15322_t:CDS:2 [Cetraspora pellucida]
MPLSLFVAQDNNMQSRIIAQAFVSNETAETYQWVLQMTKKATNNRYPNVFVTDGDPAMEQAVVLEYPGMQHLFCIWYVKENIKKMLHSKLEDSFDEFYSKFWQCKNADTLHGFEYYWRQLISFPNARLYLERYLYECQFLWACAFTVTAFTLGIQSMSFVKSQNACIKRVLESSNTSLCELGKVLMEQKQMKESLYYMTSHSTVEEVESLIICESSQSKDMDGELDAVNLLAKYVAKEGIYFGQRFGNAVTNIDTVPKNIEGQFVWLQPFNNNETGETTNEGEDELIGEQETSTHTSFNRHTIEDIPLAIPQKVTVKGRPKSASHKNAAKITLQDTGNKKKRGQYTCGFCKEPGHNEQLVQIR